jgi:hypothetical protein
MKKATATRTCFVSIQFLIFTGQTLMRVIR